MTDKPRIEGFDFARALAVLGMVVVHFSYAVWDDELPATWLDPVVELLDGRAAALFVVLAGIGTTLLARRGIEAGDPLALAEVRRVLVRRGLFLLVAGFLNLAIWPGDILRVYGVSLVVAAWLLTATNRRLLATAIGFEIGFIALFVLVDYSDHWNWDEMDYHDLWTAGGIVRNLFYDGFRSVFPWTGLLLFGMWLGRLDWRDAVVRRRALFAGFATVLAAEALSWILMLVATELAPGVDEDEMHALFGTGSMPPLPLFLLSAGGTAVAVTALSLTLAEKLAGAWWVESFVATGQMAFTWYILHLVIGLETVVQLGWEENQPLSHAIAAGLTFYALAMLISTLIRRAGHRGPLEWLLRKVAG